MSKRTILMLPLILWVLAFVVAPTVLLLVYSFCQRDELGQVVFHFTLDSYRQMFGEGMWRVFVRSIVYAGGVTFLCAVIGYPVAWYIGRSPAGKRDVLLVLVMIPFWSSFVVRAYAWMTILSDGGLLNGLLMYVHVITHPLELLYTPFSVMIGLVYAYLPFMILPIYGSIEKLDYSLVEASMDLGASPWRSFWRVILPLTWPGVTAGVLMVFVPAIGMFAVTDLLGGNQVPLLGNVIQNQFQQARNQPLGSALGIVMLALFFVTYVLCAGVRHADQVKL
jgi:spermidine/putrescine transport system permease protein